MPHHFTITRQRIAVATVICSLAALAACAEDKAETQNPSEAATATTTTPVNSPVTATTPSGGDANGTTAGDVGGAQGAGLVVSATGFAPHAGQTLFAAVVDANNHRLADTNLVVPADGNFTLSFAGVAVGGNDRLVYFADVNKNGFCNTPPLDHAWSVPLVPDENALSIVHNETFTAVCESFGDYALTFMGTGFTPHVGQTFYINVVDNADKTEVGQIQQMVIPTSGATSAAWGPLLVTGHSYTVAYFADVNKNQTCDNLGTDHAWEKTVADVKADVQVTGKHSDTQVKSVCTYFPTGKLP